MSDVRRIVEALQSDGFHFGADDEIAHLCQQRDELLDALKTALEAMTDPVIGTSDMDSPYWYLALSQAVAKARAALAKAAPTNSPTGETA